VVETVKSLKAGSNFTLKKGIFCPDNGEGLIIIIVSTITAVWLLYSIQNIMWSILIISIILGLLSVVMPQIILVVFVIGLLFIPNEILPFLANSTSAPHSFGAIRLHPVGIIIFIGSLLNIFIRKKLLIDRINKYKELKIIIILFILFSCSIFIQTILMRGLGGIAQCLETYVFPFTLFLYLLTLCPKKLSGYLKLFILFILFIGIYALVEYTFKENFFYHSLYYNSQIIWLPTMTGDIYRTTTSLGHPLKNGVYFLYAIPLTKYIFNKIPFYLISSLILILAIFSTGSRAAFLACIITFILCHKDIKTSFLVNFKNILILLGFALCFYIILLYIPFGNTIFMRFQIASGSTAVRLGSIGHISYLIKTYFTHGIGMGFSKEISTEILHIGKADFENPWIMLITEVGFLTTLVYFAVILIIFFSKIHYLKHRKLNMYIFISFLSLLIVFSTFDSFGYRNTLNFLFWFNVALLYVLGSEREKRLVKNESHIQNSFFQHHNA